MLPNASIASMIKPSRFIETRDVRPVRGMSACGFLSQRTDAMLAAFATSVKIGGDAAS